jgi:hypothetical protein
MINLKYRDLYKNFRSNNEDIQRSVVNDDIECLSPKS